MSEQEHRAYKQTVSTLNTTNNIKKEPHTHKQRRKSQRRATFKTLPRKNKKVKRAAGASSTTSLTTLHKTPASYLKETQKNAHKFYTLTIKALKLHRGTLEKPNLRGFEKKLKG